MCERSEHTSMKIVLLFFCTILGLILFSIILILLSTIKLNIKNISIKNIENGIKKKEIDKDFDIYLELYLFGKIKAAKIKITDKILKKMHVKENVEDIEKDVKTIKKVKSLEIIKMLKIKIEELNLNAEIGTEEILLTVFIVTILSSIIGIAFRNCKHENVKYRIMPLYQFGNTINFNLNCIINVKMVHIIHIIYILLKKGMIKNERTSNRRSYDYSYE